MKQVLFYTSVGCHLCEEAVAILAPVCRAFPGLSWIAVEISADAALVEQYGLRIPVVRVRQTDAELDWPFDADTLATFLASHPDSLVGADQAPLPD